MMSPPTSDHDLGSRRAVLRMAWPIGISMVSYALKSFVDTLMVGQLGLEALAGVGFAGVLVWSLISFPFGALRGQRPLVTQYLGAGDTIATRSFGVHAIYFATGISLCFLCFAGALESATQSIAGTSNMSAQSAQWAGTYLSLRMVWMTPALLGLSIAEYLRSTERPKVPMIADLIAHPLNAIFNYALIFGHWGCPALGVEGAAIGTGLADCCSLLVLLWFIRPTKSQWRSWRVDRILCWRWSRMKRVLEVGSTGGIQFALESVSFMLITYFIGFLGTTALAIQQAAIQLVHLSILPAIAIADGGSILVGKFVGEGSWREVRAVVRSVLSLVVPFMGLMGLVFISFGVSLMGLFLQDQDPQLRQEALEMSTSVVWVLALWQVGDALQVTYRHCLRATGDHTWVMWVGVLMSWVLSVPLIATVIFWIDGALHHAWLVFSVEIYVGAWLFHRRWKGEVWRTKRLVHDET